MKLLCTLLASLIFLPASHAFGGPDFKLVVPPAMADRPPARVYAPGKITPGKVLPVVVLLHGYSESPGFIDAYFGLSARVEARQFILVVPEGIKNKDGIRYWNATDGCCDFEHRQTNDAEYLLSLVATVVKAYPADKSRIYAAGHSNGGFMAHRLACEPGNPFAAIASLAGVAPLDPAACASKRPVSVLQIHALDDDTIAYAGSPGYPGLKAYPSVEQTISAWRERDACRSGPVSRVLNITRSIPGDDATAETWDCTGSSNVELRTIKAFRAPWHFPHVPLLGGDFADSILDFLFIHTND